ncbi:11433_t:CDS:1, partial [Funneliformis mosseae]
PPTSWISNWHKRLKKGHPPTLEDSQTHDWHNLSFDTLCYNNT